MLRFAPLSVFALLACGDDPGRDAANDATAEVGEVGDVAEVTPDVSESDALQIPDNGRPVAVPTDMGNPCSFGCNLDLCLDLEGCEGPCAWDDRFDQGAAYCTMRCDDGVCPPGWTCTNSMDDLDHIPFCASGAAACGNGTRDYGEACDDGNQAGGDLCNATCTDATLPETRGRVSIHNDNDGDFTYVIEESVEGGFARLTWDGVLVYGPAEGDYRNDFVLPDFGSRTGVAGPAAVSYVQTDGGCRYVGAGEAVITVFDAAQQRVAGTFELTLTCEARFEGSSECCGEEDVPSAVSVDFDMVWLARPDLLAESP